jgi:hypothetical protein
MPLTISDLQVKTNPGAAILSLDQRVALLESVLQVGSSQMTLSFGGASITLSATGNVMITGRDINMNSSSKLTIKSSGDLTMKAAKINQN